MGVSKPGDQPWEECGQTPEIKIENECIHKSYTSTLVN